MQGRGSSSTFQHINSSTRAGETQKGRESEREGERNKERASCASWTHDSGDSKKNMQTRFLTLGNNNREIKIKTTFFFWSQFEPETGDFRMFCEGNRMSRHLEEPHLSYDN